jgi:hypothetical protein
MGFRFKKLAAVTPGAEGHGGGATEPSAKRTPLSVVPDEQRRREYQKASADFTQNGRK